MDSMLSVDLSLLFLEIHGTAFTGFTWIAILKHSWSGPLLKMDLLVWYLCRDMCACSLAACLPSEMSVTPSQPAGFGWWRWVCTLLPAKADYPLTPLCTLARSKYLPWKPLGYAMASLSWCLPCCPVWAQLPVRRLPSPPCSSLHPSFSACTWAAAGRLVSRGTPEGRVQPSLCGSIATVSSKQGFSLCKSRENSSTSCCCEAGTWHSPSSHALVPGSH